MLGIYEICYPELLLGIIVLILIIYGIYNEVGKISIGMLLITGVWICTIGGSWVGVSKVMVMIGSLSILVMGGKLVSTVLILIIIVTLGSLLLITSVDWLMVYLMLELQTFSLFVLIALRKDSVYGKEGGLKYFVLSGVSSGVFLLGCTLLYGLTGEISIQGINALLTADTGKILVTISLLFKLSAVPFHMWAPDVYDGAATTITGLLSVVPKIGVYSILVQVGPAIEIVLVCGMLSIIYGSIGALNQTKMKRLLAYSGIGHMGFVLLGIGVGTLESIQASMVYMVIYVIMSICIFSILVYLGRKKELIVEIGGISRENGIIGWTLGFIFLSIAGIPPLAGFLGKWLVLLWGIREGYYVIGGIAVISSVIAGVYYVRLVKIIYFQPNYSVLVWEKVLEEEKRVEMGRSLLIGGGFYIVLFMMAAPNFILQITYDATMRI